jgi:hypothetical protein
MSEQTGDSTVPGTAAASAASAASGTNGAAVAPGSAAAGPRLATVNSVNWANVLDFAHVFRGFRLAINPAKLMLALLAILAIYVAGRAFDVLWGSQVYVDELQQYATRQGQYYNALRATRLQSRADQLDRMLANVVDISSAQREQLRNDPAGAYKALKASYKKQFDVAVAAAHTRRMDVQRLGAGAISQGGAFGLSKTPAEMERDDRARAAARLQDSMRSLQEVVGQGIFQALMKYETDQFEQLVENTLTFVRVAPVRATPRSALGAGGDGMEGQAVSGGLLSRDPDRLWRSDTVAGCIANMTITAPRWLFTATGPMQWRPAGGTDTWGGWLKMVGYRGAYLATLVVLSAFSLVVMAFVGASIARLSALEMAGIERAPLKDVFAFALRRLGVFVKAPMTPFVILLAIGCVMALVAMLGAIPYLGPLIIGAAFFAFLGVSFVLMLLLLGIIGGFNLLYPTIAVEGADSFDAMSRSFAYVYARPWRLAFYSVMALVYGVVTFLFVSFAVYLVLWLTHTFVGWGMDLFGAHYGTYSGAGALETLWPAPQLWRLITPINWYAMSWPEFGGAVMLHFWVFLLITGIGAYVVSYYFSSHTIVYLLLRRSVDGQGIKEVFMG